MSKHTPGPLMVKVSKKWPFYIETFNDQGQVVFRRDMPCYSTDHETVEDVLCFAGMKNPEKYSDANHRALADEILRAAAPELLQVLIECLECEFSVTEKSVIEKARAAIAKATGEQA